MNIPREKFNPIAELPMLPDAEIADDEEMTNLIDSTYPPIEIPKKEAFKPIPQIEIRLKGERPDELDELDELIVKKEEKEHLVAVRVIILVCLIVLVLFGIFLTLNFVPKIAENVSGFSKSFASIFTPKKTTDLVSTNTPAQIPVTIPLVATTTLQTIAYVPPTPTQTISNPPIVTQPVIITEPVTTTTPKPKTPAKIVANLLSTTAVGNRVTVRFNIQNLGGTVSGPWSFSANLPSSMTPTYHSVQQNPLTPLSGVIYTLGFDADKDLPIQIAIYTN